MSVDFDVIYQMVCGFNRSNTVLDVCYRFRNRVINVDEHKMVQWLTLNGVLKRIRLYPIYIPEPNSPAVGSASHLYRYFTGQVCYDEICVKERLGARWLNEIIENDPNVQVLRI